MPNLYSPFPSTEEWRSRAFSDAEILPGYTGHRLDVCCLRGEYVQEISVELISRLLCIWGVGER